MASVPDIDPVTQNLIDHSRVSSPHAPLAQKGNLKPHFETQETISGRKPAPAHTPVDEWDPEARAVKTAKPTEAAESTDAKK